MREKQKGCLITSDLLGKKAFFDTKFILSHSFSMLISQKPVQEAELVKKAVFRYSRAVTKELKKVTNLFQSGLFPHKKVKFVHFSTKQVCNVKKKHFQCLVNVNVNFLIYMIEISVEYTNSKAKWRSLIIS